MTSLSPAMLVKQRRDALTRLVKMFSAMSPGRALMSGHPLAEENARSDEEWIDWFEEQLEAAETIDRALMHEYMHGVIVGAIQALYASIDLPPLERLRKTGLDL